MALSFVLSTILLINKVGYSCSVCCVLGNFLFSFGELLVSVSQVFCTYIGLSIASIGGLVVVFVVLYTILLVNKVGYGCGACCALGNFLFSSWELLVGVR